MPPPIQAIVKRQERPRPPMRSAAQVNVMAPESVAPHQAPDKPRQGDVPARPARSRVYVSLARADIRSVMRDLFIMGKTELHAPPAMPRGKSLSWDERANILRLAPEAYGSGFALQPVNPEDHSLKTLLRMPA